MQIIIEETTYNHHECGNGQKNNTRQSSLNRSNMLRMDVCATFGGLSDIRWEDLYRQRPEKDATPDTCQTSAMATTHLPIAQQQLLPSAVLLPGGADMGVVDRLV